MSRKVEQALHLVYESLELLAYVDSKEGDQAVYNMSKVASLLETVYSGADEDIDPDNEDDVNQMILNFGDEAI